MLAKESNGTEMALVNANSRNLMLTLSKYICSSLRFRAEAPFAEGVHPCVYLLAADVQ